MAEKDNNPYVLFHLDHDGCAAAVAAYGRYGAAAHYIPVDYGEPMPEIPDGAEVAILDFSYDRDELIALNNRVKSLVVIDHHETAAARLAGLEFVISGKGRSACVLAAHHFHGEDAPVPELLLRVEDRDLWAFHYDDTRAVWAFLLTLGQNVESWARTASIYEAEPGTIVGKGKLLLDFISQAADLLAMEAGPMQIGRTIVPAANVALPWLISEVAHRLLEFHPDVGFVAIWSQNANGSRTFNLRSAGKVDVGKLAAKFGGGGSKKTAGFILPPPTTAESIQPAKPAKKAAETPGEPTDTPDGWILGQGYPLELVSHHPPTARRNCSVRVNDPPGPAGASHSFTVTWFNVRPGEPTDSDQHSLRFHRPTTVKGQNGLFMEDVLAILQHRLGGYQHGPAACDENRRALAAVSLALAALHERTARRERERLLEAEQPE